MALRSLGNSVILSVVAAAHSAAAAKSKNPEDAGLPEMQVGILTR